MPCHLDLASNDQRPTTTQPTQHVTTSTAIQHVTIDDETMKTLAGKKKKAWIYFHHCFTF
jgi:hypothetical protein